MPGETNTLGQVSSSSFVWLPESAISKVRVFTVWAVVPDECAWTAGDTSDALFSLTILVGHLCKFNNWITKPNIYWVFRVDSQSTNVQHISVLAAHQCTAAIIRQVENIVSTRHLLLFSPILEPRVTGMFYLWRNLMQKRRYRFHASVAASAIRWSRGRRRFLLIGFISVHSNVRQDRFNYDQELNFNYNLGKNIWGLRP